MLGKDDIRDLILKECDICLHLHGQIPAGGLDYRPTPSQRSTLELLRYVSVCAIGGARAMGDGNWGAWPGFAERADALAGADFPAAMERQKEEIHAFFDGLTQEELETRTATTPMGTELTLERALVELPLSWMIGYRMQLFLYAKQAGNEAIWTPDCWVGVSMDRPEPAQEA